MHTWGRSVLGVNMAIKEYKTIDEQIALLRSRGLAIADEELAKDFLLRNNYYRISGYSLTLRSHDVFSKNASFQNIVDIYCFDHEFRHVLLQYIEKIEVAVKSVYTHEFTRRHGPTGYLDVGHFTDPVKYKEIIDKVEKQKDSRLPHEAYLKHYIEELKEDIPLWAYIDLFTISDVSFMYKISEKEIKDAVATSLSLNARGADILESFMHSITIIRNLCAHGSRLYNRLFEQKPWLNKKEQRLLIKGKDGIVDNAHLFGFILIMRRLLKLEEFAEMKAQILESNGKYPFVDMRYYGFPKGWDGLL